MKAEPTTHPLDKLLSALDPDRDRAGEVYERLRLKLLKFFEWRGTACAEELADKTIDRVARKIDEGELIHGRDPSAYFASVAHNILLEHWDERGRERTLIRNLVRPEESPALRMEQERRYRCLEHCLSRLPPETRELILRYYRGEHHTKIEGRKAIAEGLGIPIGALRIRMHRLRSRLESCVRDCFERSSRDETDSDSGHKEGGSGRS